MNSTNSPEDITNKINEIMEAQCEIQKLKVRKDDLASQIKQAESSSEHQFILELSTESGEMSKNLRQLASQVTNLKNEVAKNIVQSNQLYRYLEIISNLDNDLAKDINSRALKFDNFYKKNLAEEIRKHYSLSENLSCHIIPKDLGASEGFIVQYNGTRYYVKESLSYREQKKINPKELFVYKVLEYSRFGPKTEFILKQFSTSRTGSQICYISTQDVESTQSKSKVKKFVTDLVNDEISNSDEQTKQWISSFKDKNFIIEFLALSMLDDILILDDTFRINPSNYGSLKISQNDQVRYKPRLIDHLPDCNNIYFQYKSLEELVENLEKKLEINYKHRSSQKKAAPASFGFFSNEKHSQLIRNNFIAVKDQAYQRLVDGKSGKEGSDLKSSLDKAREDILDLIVEFPGLFIENAEKSLDKYFKKIVGNIDKFTQLSTASHRP